MSQQDRGEELDENAKKLLKESCTNVSTRSRRGSGRGFAGAFQRNHVLVSQQDRGEELDADSRELLRGNMY